MDRKIKRSAPAPKDTFGPCDRISLDDWFAMADRNVTAPDPLPPDGRRGWKRGDLYADRTDRHGGAPVHPGTILCYDFMVPRNLTTSALGKAMHVPRQRLDAIIGGRRPVTADAALRLARYLGTTPVFWLRLQSVYDLRIAEKEHGRENAAKVVVRGPRKPQCHREALLAGITAENLHGPVDVPEGASRRGRAWAGLPTCREPTHPGQVLLKEYLEPLGITQVRAAEEMGIRHARLAAIINGKRCVTAEMAIVLERYLGCPAATWMMLQHAYDLAVAIRDMAPVRLKTVRNKGAKYDPREVSSLSPVHIGSDFDDLLREEGIHHEVSKTVRDRIAQRRHAQRKRRPMAYYQERARKAGRTHLVDPVENPADDTAVRRSVTNPGRPRR